MNPIRIAKAENFLHILPKMANRHGLIAGATGTGKTVTLQSLAQGFSAMGVPVFMADVKGDLSGMSQARGGNAKVEAPAEEDKGFDWGGVLGGKKSSRTDSILGSAAKSTARAIGSQLGRSIIRGVLGSNFKGK